MKATEAHFGQHEDLLSALNQSIKGCCKPTKLKCLKIINALIQLIQPMQSSQLLKQGREGGGKEAAKQLLQSSVLAL